MTKRRLAARRPETSPGADIAGYLAQRTAGCAIGAYAAAVAAGGTVATTAGGEGVTTSTPFHIASCSKAFTALAFARLVEEGLTHWDTPVAEVVPEFVLADPWVTANLTFRDLAGMRMGLSREGIAEWGFRPDAPVEERLARAPAMAFAAPFRDRFSYSNLGYIALATAIGRLAGAPFGDALKRLVLAPLDLAGAGLEASPRAARPQLPVGGRMTAVEELTGANSQGSARVHLSADDAGRWTAAMLEAASRAMGGEAGPAAELFAPQSIVRPRVGPGDRPSPWAYGFGWVLAEHEGRPVWAHGGAGRGWRAAIILDPEIGAGVMVMLAHEGDEAESLALELLDLARDRAPARRPPLAQPAPPEPAPAPANFVRPHTAPASAAPGLYDGPVTGRVRISLDAGGALRFAAAEAPAFDGRLIALGEGLFELAFDNPAMSRQPGDRRFHLRLGEGAAGETMAHGAYFSRLIRIEP